MAGNLLVAQSGGPTAVINASLAGVLHEACRTVEIDQVYGAINGILGVLSEHLIDLRREDTATLDLLRTTPGAALGTSRLKLSPSHYERILQVFQAHAIRYVCFIGGNDSMETAHTLGGLSRQAGYALQVMGIPKTVDNDLVGTDHCPGFGSAARFVANTVRDTAIDSRAGALSTPVKVVEIMGRHAGWLTASAALARETLNSGAPHLIYLPERPVTLEQILSDVQQAYGTFGHVVVALSEGVCDPAGRLLGAISSRKDAFGHQQLGGVSAMVAQAISERLGLKARFEKPDTMQRSSAALASPVDQAEAYNVGQEAVWAMRRGETGKMVTLEREPGPVYRWRTGLIDLAAVAGVERCLPEEYLAAAASDVTPAFLEYVRPLIGLPLSPVAHLRGHDVERRLLAWQG